ncbi:hypothetical protein BHM03_00022936 [Ensete ventricosum]|nr:hypothetical protein BHM03_00022936 [Ensete ventricosum]
MRKLIHVERERDIQLDSVLRLENLCLGLVARAHLRSMFKERIMHRGLVEVGVPDVTHLTFKSMPRVG